MDILDVPKIYGKCLNDWNIWTKILNTKGFWYSKDYHKEVMEAFEEKKDGVQIIFITVPVPPKMIENDHE